MLTGRPVTWSSNNTAKATVSQAGLVTPHDTGTVTITNSAAPVCRSEWLAEGAHVNVAGANSHDRREVEEDR